ncbi:MAG: L-aspartate oxidase [Cyanobacteriota bacterium]|nr:L-aspartate oxidase [Cyanobacteriota bacterium]
MENGTWIQHWDVIVIGGGAAGLMACLELPSHLKVLLLSKDSGPPSASRWAQGGIAAVTAADDSFTSHRQDTIRAGAGLCDHAAVELLVHQAPACVTRLLDLGMAFDRENGRLSTTLEAAHSHRRVLHAQDRTGGALVDALEREVQRRPGLVQHRGVMALRLWLQNGRCCGVQILVDGQIRWIAAGAVVLATGGGGHLFAHTTNPDLSSGDGVAMAWQAGASVRDLEFVQFHPTALMLPGAPHFLISEAVRGEGARLVDHDGNSPVEGLVGGDLAPRDQVSRALARRMREQAADHLWLDLRPVGRERLERQFPTILGRCRELGLAPLKERIPVAPAAHYWMGGVSTDLEAATDLPGLYAVGEVACTGVHGANRLASNSLMECLVFARQLGRLKPAAAATTPHSPQGRSFQDPLPDQQQLRQQIATLRHQCWSVAGVERCGHALTAALPDVTRQRHELEHQPGWQTVQRLSPSELLQLAPGQEGTLRLLHELHDRLILAELLIRAALFREESRGGHFRTDAPTSQPFWQRHSRHSQDSGLATSAVDLAVAGPALSP